MWSPIAFCSYCNDEYDPIEGVDPPQDPDEVQFCSDDCAERYQAAEDAAEAYEGASTGAPVFGP